MTDIPELNRELGLQMEPDLRILDFVSETGELAKEILNSQDYGDTEFERSDKVTDEFGDVYYCLLSLADELGIDPEEALEDSVDKYRDRLSDTGDIGSGE